MRPLSFSTQNFSLSPARRWREPAPQSVLPTW